MNKYRQCLVVNRSKSYLASSAVKSVAVWGTTTPAGTSWCVSQSELLCPPSWGTHRRLWKQAMQWWGHWSKRTVKCESIWRGDVRAAFRCSVVRIEWWRGIDGLMCLFINRMIQCLVKFSFWIVVLLKHKCFNCSSVAFPLFEFQESCFLVNLWNQKLIGCLFLFSLPLKG